MGSCPGQKSDFLNQRATECTEVRGGGQLVKVRGSERSQNKSVEAETQICTSKLSVQASAPQGSC